MNLDVVLKNKLNTFQQEIYSDAPVDDKLFERFVNYHFLRKLWKNDMLPQDARELTDAISVGGGGDLGLDGVIVFLNHCPVVSIDDAKSLLDDYRKGNQPIEAGFVFLQAKCKATFTQGEYLTFLEGVRNFLFGVGLQQPVNERVEEFRKIKELLLSDDVQPLPFRELPSVKLYYVFSGKDTGYPQVEDANRGIRTSLKDGAVFHVEQLRLIGAETLRTICRVNDEAYTGKLYMPGFQPVDVTQSHALAENFGIGFVSGTALYQFCTTEDGGLRRNLFEDNVRDFLGDSNVNKEILATIEQQPEEFRMLNNGITIVCDSFEQRNVTLLVENPRIVNGCQTTSVICQAGAETQDLDKIAVLVRIIATKNQAFIADIVRGTNKQNIVYDEAYEGIKKYHKVLEEYFPCEENQQHIRLFYERRTKQYQRDKIPKEQIFTFRNLIQGDVAIFLGCPHRAHGHPSVLVREFASKTFQPRMPRERYYTVALIEYRVQKYLRQHPEARKSYKPYPFHLMWIVRMLLDSSKGLYQSPKDYQKLMHRFEENATALIEKSLRIFTECKQRWEAAGNSEYSIKDNEKFTKLLHDCILENWKTTDSAAITYEETGEVGKLRQDRYGKRYAFVYNAGKSYFLHEDRNEGLPMNNLEGKRIGFSVEEADAEHLPYAVRAFVIGERES